MVSAPRLPLLLSALSGEAGLPTKLARLLESGALRRPDELHAIALAVHTALARHKPSTQRQYDTGRRLVARWLNAEGRDALTFADFRLLA
jgi:hypothetical protein